MLYTTKSHVLHEAFICHDSVTTMPAKLSAKQILHRSQVLKDKVEYCYLFWGYIYNIMRSFNVPSCFSDTEATCLVSEKIAVLLQRKSKYQ